MFNRRQVLPATPVKAIVQYQLRGVGELAQPDISGIQEALRLV